ITDCIHLVVSVKKLPTQRLSNNYLPKCDENGKFAPIQCDQLQCWCVDVNYGTEITGSAVLVAMKRGDMCRDLRLCGVKCSNHCPHGLKMTVFGCPDPTCACRDLIYSSCPNNADTCQLIEPDCAQPPCLPVPRCLLNPCPAGQPMTLQNGVTALCATSDQCSPNHWCHKVHSIFAINLAYLGVYHLELALLAPCNNQDPVIRQLLLFQGKCCFDGCGLSCSPLEAPKMHRVIVTQRRNHHFQPGDVATHNKGVLSSLVADCPSSKFTNCTSSCASDNDCVGMKRCCRVGCSTQCLYPIRTTRELSLRGHGYFDDGCFCVDIDSGDEISGTRTTDSVPNCEGSHKCPDVVCRTSCPYEFERDANGCRSCRCKNPCAPVKCHQGSYCIMTAVNCFQSENCPPQPRCVLNLCPRGEPFISQVGVVETCNSNDQCPPRHWCHQVGFSSTGLCCALPARAVHAGRCPPTAPLLHNLTVCGFSCRSDGDCQNTEKCCYDGCGLHCKDLSSPSSANSTSLFDECSPIIPIFSGPEENPCYKNQCTSDDECVGVQKCCSDGCSKKCLYPENGSACVQAKSALQMIGQSERIQCRPDGSFEEVQCDSEFCWCVNDLGVEVEGTRSSENIPPNCKTPLAKPITTLNRRVPIFFNEYSTEPRWSPGTCPPTIASNGDCSRHCLIDEQCPSSQKCCFNGCGLSCVARIQHEVRSYRGKDPECMTDGDCSALRKCCSDGCTRRCTAPDLTTHCVHARLAALAIYESDSSVFVPECDSNGDYTPIQTHYGLKWCVDKIGREMPGTKTTHQVNCKVPRPCPVRACHKHCPFGYRTDNAGCTVCDCIVPCELVQCQAGFICRVVQPRCYTKDCPPIARCLPNICPVGEPLVSPGADHLAECDVQRSCPAGYFCTQNGYEGRGFCCPGHAPPPSPITCPPIPLTINAVDSSACVVACRRASDCPQKSVCCFNGCGTSCQFETGHHSQRRPLRCWSVCHLQKIPIQRGILSSHHSLKKVGVCPSLLLNPGCREECLADADCASFSKCCKASCGTRCVEPTRFFLNNSIIQLIAFLHFRFVFFPFLLSLFIRKPLRRQKLLLFIYLPPTAYSGHHVHFVAGPKICSVSCGHSSCDYGIRVDANGCPHNGVCLCKNPCDVSFLDLMGAREAEWLKAVMRITSPCDSNYVVRDLYGNAFSCRNDSCPRGKCVIGVGETVGICCQTPQTTEMPAYIKARSSESYLACYQTYRLQFILAAPRICPTQCSRSMCPYGPVLDQNFCPFPDCRCSSPCNNVTCKGNEVCLAPSSLSLTIRPILGENSPCNVGDRPVIDPRTKRQFYCRESGEICPTGFYCTGFDAEGAGVCCPGRGSIYNIQEPLLTKAKTSSCPHGDPFASSSDGTPLACSSKINSCPSTHYCSTHPGGKVGICCVSKRYVCGLNPERGPCSVTVPRYFYSPLNQTCSSFDYGGCSGNLNNFATKEHCEAFCDGRLISFPYLVQHLSYVTLYFRGLAEFLSQRFSLSKSSIDDVIILDDNTARFTIKDPHASRIAKSISEAVSCMQKLSKMHECHHTSSNTPLTVLHYISKPQFFKIIFKRKFECKWSPFYGF
ncbi:unnamed protein product, partial [Haemonchus placei]|uniref:WAP domain-containing protein n=1 Tax=Haemonchus placei TaxID=6290 RepID=A0A158QKT4_HAEPC